MTTTNGVLSGLDATLALAGLSLKRVLRSKSLWFAVVIGLLPCIAAAISSAYSDDRLASWRDMWKFVLPLVAIVPPILIASSLSDEIDDKTAAYLWSRALPRWSVLIGKLLGLTPIAAATLAIGMLVSWLIFGGPGYVPVAEFVQPLLGVVAATVGACVVSAMVATVAPRFAVPIAMAWLLLDTAIGAMTSGLHVIAVTYGARTLARNEDVATGMISLAVIVALTLTIAIRRIDRIE